MSLIPFGFWAASGAGAGISYWLASLGGASRDHGNAVSIDSAGNAYAVGFTESQGAGSRDFLIAKYESAGTVEWQRVLGGASSDQADAAAVSSSGDVYAFGVTSSAGAGGQDFLLAKYNSSGTIQWQRVLGDGTGNEGDGVAVDSSGDVYVSGTTDEYPNEKMQVAKYNSSGTLQWQRVLGGSGSEYCRGAAVDSSSNLYAVGHTNASGAGGFDVLIAKYNSSGTIQWQRTLGGSGSDSSDDATIDSSGNLYVAATTSSTGPAGANLLLAKYNSAGTIQWQRVLGSTSDDQSRGVVTDSLDNVYISGYTNSSGAGGYDMLIAKYNSSGTLQWQRRLGGSGNDNSRSLSISAIDELYVLGYTASTGEGGDDLLLAKLPSDGSLTGTYVLDGVNMVYQSSSLTASTSTLTAATSTLTAATSTLTAATSTLTAATSTLTSHFVEIPA